MLGRWRWHNSLLLAGRDGERGFCPCALWKRRWVLAVPPVSPKDWRAWPNPDRLVRLWILHGNPHALSRVGLCFLECKQRAASCGKSKPCCSAAWQTGTSGLSCTMRARSSFVLPPTPGNETKSPERNFHPRLIMKRISLITLVDCGHCSASFSKKKKEEKSCWKYFNALLLLWARPSVNPFGISSFLSPSIALPNSAYFISLPLISVLASAYSSLCSLL